MPTNSHSTPPDPEVFVSTTKTSARVSQRTKAGELRKLGSRLYTSNLVDPEEELVRKHLWSIVSMYFPGALIADRTALENVPASDGSYCLITDKGGPVELPGVTLRPRRGVGPLPSDKPFPPELFICSPARAYLENMRLTRSSKAGVQITLKKTELEERLDQFIRIQGEAKVNELRDQVRELAPVLDMEQEAVAFDELVSTLLRTGKARIQSEMGRARASGKPYDPDRLEVFRILHRTLRETAPAIRQAIPRTTEEAVTLAFYDAYFSNYIEGSKFAVDEAERIVFEHEIPTTRPDDAHDIIGTYRITSSQNEMQKTPKNFTSLLDILKQRHAIIMAERPEKRPGHFKRTPNQAGSTVFVQPSLVQGTLHKGFELLASLDMPFDRAIFMMFLVSEVHPFDDGNGRVARLMMNAELITAGQERIIIPTVYRDEYLSALKGLSHNNNTESLLHVLAFAQKWTRAVPWGELRKTEETLKTCNAFLEPNEAENAGKRLSFPTTAE